MSEQTKGAELLPCPFCGGEDLVADFTSGGFRWMHVRCSCGALGPGVTMDYDAASDTAEAIAAWSRRAEPVADPGDTRRLDWLEAKQAALLPVEGNIMPAGTWAVEQAADDVDMGPGPRGAIDEAMKVEAHRALNEEAKP